MIGIFVYLKNNFKVLYFNQHVLFAETFQTIETFTDIFNLKKKNPAIIVTNKQLFISNTHFNYFIRKLPH